MLNWVNNIIMQHLLLVLVLIFIPAIGRVIQTNGFGNINTFTYWMLEIPVEGARILFLIFLIGDGKFVQGLERLDVPIRMIKEQWKTVPATIINNLKLHSTELIITTLAFILFALVLNYLIKYTINSGQLVFKLQQSILLKYFNPVSVILFLKNITIIPLTIIFEVWLILKLLK